MTKQELKDKFDEIIDVIDALPDDAYILGIIDTDDMPRIEDLADVYGGNEWETQTWSFPEEFFTRFRNELKNE